MEATFSQCPASEASAWMLPTGTSISYTVHDAKPLVLESDDMFKLRGSDALNKKYLSPISPLTIKLANEALHQEESAEIVGCSSGVIRYDTSGWETAAALLELFVLYIVHELEAVSSSGFSSNGM